MKSYLQSKLFWTGIATVAVAVIDAGYQAYAGGGDFRTAVLAGVGALVIVLRKYTSSEIVFAMPRKVRQLKARKLLQTVIKEAIESDPYSSAILKQGIGETEHSPRE